MKLDRLHLNGFGKFSDKTLEFGPGLNLIYGENESGKSTLQHFLRGMLFGLKKPGTRRSYDELLERFRPWSGSSYAGTLEYTLEHGSFRVERNFEPDDEKVRILDGVTWQDITPQFVMDKRKEVLFAQEHFGISQVIFDNTVSVRQLNSKSSSDLASEISTKLVNLASAGEEDVSVQKALQVIETGLKEIGLSERSSRTPLGKVSTRVEQLEQARQQTLSVYAEIRVAEANHQELTRELQSLEELRQQLLLQVEALEVRDIGTKLQKIAEYDKRMQEISQILQGAGTLRGFPAAKKDNLLLAMDRIKTIEHKVTELATKEEEISRRITLLKQALTDVEEFAAFDQESIQNMEGSFTRLEGAAQQAEKLEQKIYELAQRRANLDRKSKDLSGCARIGVDGEAEVSHLEDQLNELNLKAWSFNNERLKSSEINLAQKVKFRALLALISLVGGLLLGMGLGIGIHWSFSLLVLLGLGLSMRQWLANRQDKSKLEEIRQKIDSNRVQLAPIQIELERTNQRLATLLAEAEVKSSRELYEKMRQWTLLEHTHQTVTLELVELEDQLGKFRQKIREEAGYLRGGFLASTGIVDTARNITRADLEQFVVGLGRFGQIQGELALTMGRQKENVQEQKRITDELQRVKGELEGILDEAKVSNPEDFLSKWQLAQQLDNSQQEWEALNLARTEVIGDTSLKDLQEDFERLRAKIAGSAWRPPEELPDKQTLLAELGSVTDKIQDTKELIANLQGIIKTRLEGVGNLAEVERELLEAWQEKERILKRRQALELARHTIEDVAQEVQRDFAPLVNQHMGQTLSSLTAGRYLASKIDHQLNVKVVVPEVNEVKDIGDLSLGTVDQIYFALRLALADLIGVKFPLLLDEPFSQYDDNRLKSALELLLQLAEERQILLFTCHRRELDVLQKLDPKFKIVALSA